MSRFHLVRVLPQPHASPVWAVISSLPRSYEWPEIVYDATLLGGTSNGIGVLWSLQWEVVFSLLLTVVASFAIAVGFYYAFERPIHRLARRLNRSIQRKESAGASAVRI